MALRETENNAYAKFWGDKQRALWYVMVFSGVDNSIRNKRQGELIKGPFSVALLPPIINELGNVRVAM